MVKTVLKIDGMMCGMCEAHINDTVRRSFNVRKVSSSHKSAETVILSDAEIDENALKATIAGTGYTVLSVNSEQYVKRGLFSK